MRGSGLRAPFVLALVVTSAVAWPGAAPPVLAQSREEAATAPVSRQEGPFVITSLKHDLSPPLTEIARSYRPPRIHSRRVIEIPELVENNWGAVGWQAPVPDPVVQDWVGDGRIPDPEFTFEGIRNSEQAPMVTPPDTNGDIGPNHYVQTVNLVFSVYNRAGTRLLGPLPNNAPFAGFGGDCETRNNGDPIVLYDPMADRWLLSQFTTASPFHQCIAISQTPDPTGAWYRYDFLFPGTAFNDYPKFGVWPDAYYLSASSRGIPGPPTDVVAYERDRMLAGQPARQVSFRTDSSLGYVAPMPADLDGPLPPAGAPNPFVGVKQSVPQALYIFRFHVDWVDPTQSTFGVNGLPNDTLTSVAPFTLICPSTRNCVPQPPPTTIGLDALTGRYVMYRNQYRNFGTHETLVFNGTVDANSGAPPARAGVRWYEIRNPNGTPTIHQQGTYAPADGQHRWMGSAAMDRNGNLAVGYSVSSTTVFPGIRYAGRLSSDPLGELTQGEAVLIDGSGSQTSTGSRWGDYSMMAVDPVDDCTFWYTTEYYTTTSTNGWQTRIGRFRFPNCLVPDFTVAANPPAVSIPVGGSAPSTITVQSLNDFSSQVDLRCRSVATAGITCSFTPGSVTPPPNGAVNTTLTVSVDGSVAPGGYWVQVVGRSGGVERTARVDVTVTTPVAPSSRLSTP